MPKYPDDISAQSELALLRRQIQQERDARLSAEERIRTVMSDYKRMENDLIRYRDHFESMLAHRTSTPASVDEQLRREDLERRPPGRECRRHEDQFHETLLMFETILDAIPDIIGIQDRHHRIIRFNQAGYSFFGGEDQVAGRYCFELTGRSSPCDDCVAAQVLKNQRPAQVEKYIPGKGVWMDIRAYPIRDRNGRISRIVEHWRDITDIKKSEASLIESEEKYRLLVENATEGIFIFQGGAFTFSNRKAREMAEKLGVEKTHTALEELIYPDDRGADPNYLTRRLNGADPSPHTISFRLIEPDGEAMWVELNTINITWKGTPGTLNFIRDINQSKALERRFQEAQRMESLGTLAGGIAHDFNNLLMGIQGNVSLMYLEIENDPSLSEKLRNIEDCVDSGSRLTKQLLGFARGGKYVVKPTDMNHILHNSGEMFGRTRKTIRIHEHFQADLWKVMADAGQVEQVMVNLFLNAWQAMNGTGDLHLKTMNVTLEPAFVRPFEVPPGRYVKISVTDTGIGMDEDTQRRIFEPFFTTNEPGRGTGLGLASVFGIVKNHNGIITVNSRPGKGSTFDVYLPAWNRDSEADAQPLQTTEPGTETILLIDDEDFIIDVSRLMLEGLGYTLLVANNGRDAIRLFEEKKDQIDLVILDMVMPDMDGEEVFARLRSIRSDIRVIFASGFYVMEQAKSLIRNGLSDFLQKPFDLHQLSAKVRSMLDGP